MSHTFYLVCKAARLGLSLGPFVPADGTRIFAKDLEQLDVVDVKFDEIDGTTYRGLVEMLLHCAGHGLEVLIDDDYDAIDADGAYQTLYPDMMPSGLSLSAYLASLGKE